MIDLIYQKDKAIKRFNNQLANELFTDVSRKISLHDKMNLLRVERFLGDNVQLNISCEVYRRINNESTR